MKKILKSLLVSTSLILSYHHASASEGVISRILVEAPHAKHIVEEIVRKYAQEGKEYTSDIGNNILQSLQHINFLENINVDFRNGNLIARATKSKFIHEIVFKGNSKISAKKLNKTILSKKGTNFSEQKIELDLNRLKEIYNASGRLDTRIELKIEDLDKDRIKIIFEVTEAPKIKISSIKFIGNKNYNNSELKRLLASKENSLMTLLTGASVYQPGNIEMDKMMLNYFYQSLGYADFRIVDTKLILNQTKSKIDLIYAIEEGQKYLLGNILLTSDLDHLDSQKIQKLIDIKTKEKYNLSKINSIIQKISEYLLEQGYSEMKVNHKVKKNFDNNTIDVEFTLVKSSKFYINKINFIGNEKTNEKVLRRLFKIYEGSLFNNYLINQAERRLRGTGYFSKVSIARNIVSDYPENTKKQPSPENHDQHTEDSIYSNYLGVDYLFLEDGSSEMVVDRVNLDVEVDDLETKTGQIHLNVSSGTIQSFAATLGYEEKNFLGEGLNLNTGVSLIFPSFSTKQRTYSSFLAFADNSLFNTDLRGSLAVSADNSLTSPSSDEKEKVQTRNRYNTASFNLAPSVKYEILEDLSHTIGYKFSYDDSTLVEKEKDETSPFVIELLGENYTSSISDNLTYNKLDNIMVPKNGYFISLSNTLAGIFGTKQYFKSELHSYFMKSFSDNKYTFKASFDAGIILPYGEYNLKMNDRFKLGDSSFKGFDIYGLGPREKKNSLSLGGEKYWSTLLEMFVPLPLFIADEVDFYGVVFGQVGDLWGFETKIQSEELHDFSTQQIRSSLGIGIIWKSPLGIDIRFDLAQPITKTDFDKTSWWHFGISYGF